MKKIGGFWAAASAVCLMLLLSSIALAGAFEVPDTGITKCYDAVGNEIFPCPGPGQLYYGQDGNLIHNGMSFIDNGETLTDSVTGLVWQKGASTAQPWQSADDYCDGLNSSGLGGHNTGWRLPELIELNTILDLSVDTGTGAAAIDSAFSGPAGRYWTSTVDPDNSAKAWFLDFSSTEDGIEAKALTFYTRCVWTEVAP